MNDLAQQLRKAVDEAPSGDRVVTIHLFGIGHAARLEGVNLQELAERAGIGKSFGTELRKGIRLASFVQLNALGHTRI
jgi:hypothetical protein